MYKRYKITKKFEICFNTFPNTAKEVSYVYRNGIRYWKADDSYNYSIVIKTFRVILSINRKQLDCCQ